MVPEDRRLAEHRAAGWGAETLRTQLEPLLLDSAAGKNLPELRRDLPLTPTTWADEGQWGAYRVYI